MPTTGDVFALYLDVHQHLWDCGRDETEVRKRKIKEEVHGSVEV
jgi:hypothetical protein